ncbi:perforin-1-like [Mantella aurantiaca]
MKTTGSFPLDLQRVGKNCTLCNNPHVNNALQKLPMGLVNWRPETSCSRHITSKVLESKLSLANDATSSVQNDWKVGLEVEVKVASANVAVGGSHSDLAKFSDSKIVTDKYNYLSNKLQCTYYSFYLAPDAPLTSHFAQEIRKLPRIYNKNTKAEYRRFIGKYGTHYITQARVGGRTQEVTAVKTCEVTMDGLTLDEVKDCLNVEAQIAASTPTKSGKLDSKLNYCKEKAREAKYGENFHQTFSDRTWEVIGGKATYDLLSAAQEKKQVFENWMQSLKTDPSLVSYSLDPIHNLVRFKGPQKNNLRLAVGDYIREMAISKRCSCPAHLIVSSERDCPCVCSTTKYTGSNCCPTRRGTAKLQVTIKAASGLWGDYVTKTDAYVKFKFGSANLVSRTIWNNNNPRWGETFELDFVDLAAGKKYTIEVWDEDNKYDDDLLGECNKPLTSGVKSETCYLSHGEIQYSISATCFSFLQGPYCESYSPVPPK